MHLSNPQPHTYTHTHMSLVHLTETDQEEQMDTCMQMNRKEKLDSDDRLENKNALAMLPGPIIILFGM